LVRPSFVLGALLLLSLGAKAAWTREAPAPDAALFTREVQSVLEEGGFTVLHRDFSIGTMSYGRRGACTILVSEYDPHGTIAEPIERLARPLGRPVFLWRGRFSAEAPKLAPLMEFYLERELRRAGFRPSRRPIAAIAATPGCGIERLRWSALDTLAA
jgi:hypothetical protein